MAEKKFSGFINGGEVRVGDEVTGLRPSDPTNNYRFDFPGVGIKDPTGNFMLGYGTIGVGAVNYAKITNSLSTLPVVYGASGSDSDISIDIKPKGTGTVTIDGLKFPESDGVSGQAVVTDGLGTLTLGITGTDGGGTGLGTTNNSSILATDNAGTPFYTSSLTDGQIVIGATGGNPLPATITAGAGISVTNSTNSITIDNIQASSDVVIVNSLSDLPAPVSGVRQLAANTTYVIVNDLSDSNQWAFPHQANCSITANKYAPVIQYTGSTDFLITNAGETFKNISLEKIILKGTGSTVVGSKLVKVTGMGAPTAVDLIENKSILKITDCASEDTESLIDATDCGIEGIRYTSQRSKFHLKLTNGYFNIVAPNFANDPAGSEGAATFIQIVQGSLGTNQFFALTNASFSPKATDTLFNIDPTYTGSARVFGGESKSIPANFFAPGGLTQRDDLMRFFQNTNLPQSLFIAESRLNILTNVVITTQNVVVPIAGGNWVQVPTTQRFTCDTNGLCTYNSEAFGGFEVIMIATIRNLGGGTDKIGICPIINGIPDENACQPSTNSTPTSITTTFTVVLAAGQTLQVGVVNNSSTNDIEVTSARVLATRAY